MIKGHCGWSRTTEGQSLDKIEATPEDSKFTQRYINAHSNVKRSWIGVWAFLDTGADDSWIHEDLVRRLELEVNTRQSKQVTSANRGSMRSTGTVEVDWRFKGSAKIRRSIFQVATHLPFELLLCSNLHFEEGIFNAEKKCLVMVKDTAKLSKGMLSKTSIYILYRQGMIVTKESLCGLVESEPISPLYFACSNCGRPRDK